MFKDKVFTSEQIHRSLASKNQQLWVWIGLRGVYALKEWGFIKPDKGLCQTVFEIVSSGFSQTSKPVHLSYIHLEIGKYRKMINENSLYFGCNFNPRIKVIKKDLFMPILRNEEAVTKDVISKVPGYKKENFPQSSQSKLSKKDLKFLNSLDKQFRKKLS